MFVYLSIMLLCCILLYVMRKDKKKARPLAIVFGLIWIVIALQDGWGGDHDNYVMYYDQLSGLNFLDLFTDDNHGEIGYKILAWSMPSEHAGLMLGMAIWCFSFAFLFYHFIPQRWWFFAILFVFLDRSILMGAIASYFRMAIATSLLVFAVFLTLRNKKIIAIGLIIIGAFFHKSVLFLLPLVFVWKRYNRVSTIVMIGIFAMITIISMLFPSTWISFVENIVMGIDAFESYSIYFEDNTDNGVKGLVLIVLFYWIYLLSIKSSEKGFEKIEYMVMYYALIRIAFDLLPAVGLSTRFFYFIDIYFFAGMMVLMNRLPKNDINKLGIAITLILIFWYTGFRVYSNSEFYQLHWATYNPIF